MINQTKSEALYQKALQYFPGGVNSPVRAFKAVGGTPVFAAEGQGSRFRDVDGNEYIDFCCSWGPLILGHAHPAVTDAITRAVQRGTSFGMPTEAENELADLILSNNRYLEKLRFVSSGTEAVMSALRLARGATGRSKVIKFDGCYHGHVDSLLVNAGSGLATFGVSSSAGVPQAFAGETIVLPLNDTQALDKVFGLHKADIAAIIIEPVPANNGLLLQSIDFLHYLRKICTEYGVLLIFDEVISGFRLGFEGAAGHYGIQPDLLTYGKIIGGGMPVGAYGGSRELMSHIAPDGAVYQAGTLSGNPVAMHAGIATLKQCLQPGFYEDLQYKTQFLVQGINKHAQEKDYPVHLFGIGSIFWIAFTRANQVRSATEIDADRMRYFRALYPLLLERGVYLGPSGYEVGFVSSAHTSDDLLYAQQIIKNAFDLIFR